MDRYTKIGKPENLKEMDLERGRRFISKVQFREAKTYKDTHPHEYIVKTNLSDIGKVEFEWFLFAINRNGVYERFYELEFPYWELDGYKYWMNLSHCFTGVNNCFKHIVIINRKPSEQKRTDL